MDLLKKFRILAQSSLKKIDLQEQSQVLLLIYLPQSKKFK